MWTMSRYQFTCEAEPQYVPEQSDPQAPLYLFAYTITIRNSGEVPRCMRSVQAPAASSARICAITAA